jgi:hypothetical protein
MGEARDRMLQGLPPRTMKAGEQIPIDLKDATPKVCECGCDLFVPVMKVFTVSALISPIGQELAAQVPVLICQKCGMELK